jgi:hypothetical protein
MFREFMAQDIDPSEADIWAVIQKPMRQSIFTERSGPPAWKQLSTWYQISEEDHMIPPKYPTYLRSANKRYYIITKH